MDKCNNLEVNKSQRIQSFGVRSTFSICVHTSEKSFATRQRFFASFSPTAPSAAAATKKRPLAFYSLFEFVFFYLCISHPVSCIRESQAHLHLQHCFRGRVCVCVRAEIRLITLHESGGKVAALLLDFNLIFMFIQCFTCVTTNFLSCFIESPRHFSHKWQCQNGREWLVNRNIIAHQTMILLTKVFRLNSKISALFSCCAPPA